MSPGNCYPIIDIIAVSFLLSRHRRWQEGLLAAAHTPNDAWGEPLTEPHVGYSGKQIAHAVSLDTNHANAFVTDAVDNFCPSCGHGAQEA